MKVLNCYCGIGGNRKLWNNVDVTAVEINPSIAKIYQDFFPDDKVIVTDAHQYLLDHYKEFDFIWSSPPCPTHSDIRRLAIETRDAKVVYPDMNLYQEIIILNRFFKGIWVVENVKSYYNPLIKPQERGRHYFWANFHIEEFKDNHHVVIENVTSKSEVFGVKLDKYKINDKRKILRNQVNPKLGLHIFNYAFKIKQTTLK